MIKKLFAATVFAFMITASARAQSGNDLIEVGAAVEKLRKAMIDGNKKDLESIAMNELSYGHSGGHVEGKAEFVEKIVSGKSDFVTIDLTEQVITVVGNTAIVRHKLSATTNDNNKPGEVHLGVLLVFQKVRGDWKLLARQAVKLTS